MGGGGGGVLIVLCALTTVIIAMAKAAIEYFHILCLRTVLVYFESYCVAWNTI